MESFYGAMAWFVKTVKGKDLPSDLPKRVDLKPKAEVMSILGIPPIKINGEKMDWRTVEDNMEVYRYVGVSHLFIWCFWSHVDYLDYLEVKTDEGTIKLRMMIPNFLFIAKDFLTPDPERGGEEGFKSLINRAHSLGLRVIPQLCINAAYGDSYILREHPDWILRSIHGGYAVPWPWITAPWGYVVNKAHPGLIRFVTETLMPKWIIDWGADGIFLDYPAIFYCDPRIYGIYKRIGISENARRICYDRGLSLEECIKPVAPVDGYYSGEPLVAAMRRKINELKSRLGRELTFGGEFVKASYMDYPDEAIEATFKGRRLDEPIEERGSLSKYFDWIWDYRFASLLLNVARNINAVSSSRYVDAVLKNEEEKDGLESAKFVNMLNTFWSGYRCLHSQATAECYLTLLTTAPGGTLWIGCYQLDSLEEAYLLRAWYRRLLMIKRAYPSLIHGRLENALIEPEDSRVIAYNRWSDDEAVTVAVNVGQRYEAITLRTRFKHDKVRLLDLLRGEIVAGEAKRLEVEVPPFTALILVEDPRFPRLQ